MEGTWNVDDLPQHRIDLRVGKGRNTLLGGGELGRDHRGPATNGAPERVPCATAGRATVQADDHRLTRLHIYSKHRFRLIRLMTRTAVST